LADPGGLNFLFFLVSSSSTNGSGSLSAVLLTALFISLYILREDTTNAWSSQMIDKKMKKTLINSSSKVKNRTGIHFARQ
jgi:hypothetical protein